MNGIIWARVRPAARLLLHRIIQSSAYRTNLCPRRSNSLSNSLSMILLRSGLKLPPCGAPIFVSTNFPFVDMARLTPDNIKRYENGLYIVYKRHKTKNSQGSKAINIKLSEELQTLINELSEMKKPVDTYLLPIVTIENLTGEKLYNHLKTRLKKLNSYLDGLADEFEISDINLTSYVSRHTMAMSLQNNEVPREVISQILGHKDLKTTNTYLDSFNSNVIDEAVKVL